MLVDEAMTKTVLTVSPSATLSSLLLAYCREETSRLVYVVDKAAGLIGIISSFDVLTKLVGGGGLNRLLGRQTEFILQDCIEKHRNITAADLMLTRYVSIGPYENILRAMELISQKRILALPVVSEGKFHGEVSRYSILRAVALSSRGQAVQRSLENRRTPTS